MNLGINFTRGTGERGAVKRTAVCVCCANEAPGALPRGWRVDKGAAHTAFIRWAVCAPCVKVGEAIRANRGSK